MDTTLELQNVSAVEQIFLDRIIAKNLAFKVPFCGFRTYNVYQVFSFQKTAGKYYLKISFSVESQ